MERLGNIVERANIFFSYIGAIFIILMVVLVVMSVINRYFLGVPMNWPSEISQYLQCAAVMLPAGYCLRIGIHTRVDIFYGGFSPRKRMWVEIYSGLFAFCSSIPIIWYGAIIGWNSFTAGERSSSADQIPLWPSVMSVPLGAFFLGLQGLISVWQNLISLRNQHKRGSGEKLP
jgi:TRAP-type mannitol/chloroaromatic compound transport system permease small subunit